MSRTVASLPPRQPHYRLHQSGRGSQNLSTGKDSRVTGGDAKRECARARSACACGRGLRDCARSVHAVVVSGGTALSAGRHAVAGGTRGRNQCGRYSGISQARTRLGWEPVRQLHDDVVQPIAVAATKGAWYRAWRLVSADGSTLDVADEKGNNEAFGRPGASGGESAYPKIRFVSLVENGTHVLFGSRMADYATSEVALAKTIWPSLRKGMLCLADRGFFGFEMWKQAAATGADLLWRVRKNIHLPCEKRLPDGSYLSRIYASQQDQRRGRNGIVVRVIAYRLEGIEGAEPLYRLATTILAHELAPVTELAALYHERWEIETAFDELKTHLRGAHIVLRSKTPDLVRQEFYGLRMAHFAVRGLMIGIGAAVTRRPLPHHRAYGSVHGGSSRLR
jgi:Transposase DDE domain